MLLPARTGALARAHTGRTRWPGEVATETWVVIALTVLAAGLRVALIGSQSYWLDESQAAHELGLSFGGMLRAWSSAEWNPPLYLIVAWPWARLFGTGEVGLRSLSALAGVAVAPLLYLCGRELVSARAGVVAAALAVVNPFMIWYSQEAREYMLMTALCTGSLLFFARAWRRRSRRDLLWWAVLSALALLTQYFAAFLIAAEGLALVWRLRRRTSALALGAMAVVLAPLVPHVIPHLRRPALFITAQPLALRLQQVPVTFGLGQLYKGPLVSDGLLGAAALAAAVIGLLVAGAGDRELRGAAIAATLAAAVLLVPLALALLGHDDYIARGLMPAWPPLAIVIGAACAAERARIAGAVLAAVLVVAFVWADIETDSNRFYQRDDWRGVAAALGTARGTRAIATTSGQFATGPLSYYLPRVLWSGPGAPAARGTGPATIDELDIIGNVGDQLASRLPRGWSLIAERGVDGYLVVRLALPAPWSTDGAAITQTATQLLSGVVVAPPVMIQRRSASGFSP
ncbi:MAG: glycosyltransferase family 39 protein [Solirubrobacteraceae bacterium]